MDKFWSIFAMPIGVAMCFGPAMVIWWLTKDRPPAGHKSDESDKG
jgi:hypothetical protein